ncbi:NAD-dependent epimerase/dehydratase family protein [Arthrobacter sp. BB-1]|uniref:SDR family oxidoreductase n=1 Tax=unclassified Arthrobacter TaxID=235627 RepID=UPI00111194C8|nr:MULTISPECIES: NAD(P)H-binding protein [unclassified Arthrobacter]TNB70473.1 NAD-dependent epimerase/dehydratase family protein [Arthrobacter sp. BB-1]
MRIAVAGGTGTVGRHVVAVAKERGHDVVSLSRAEGVDLVNGRGLARALAGMDTVIDVSGIQTTSTKQAVDFFTNATQNLLAAEMDAGVQHHVALSIVGIDGATSGLYAGKLVQEDEVRHGGIPWTLLRSTQFHEFVPLTVKIGSVGPLVAVPKMVTQPIAAREVAEALVDAAEAGPRGRITDLGGPRTEELADLVRTYLAKTGERKKVLEAVLPGRMGKAMRSGALVPAPGAAVGRQTFQQWLEASTSSAG